MTAYANDPRVRYVRDLLERALATFVQAFLAALVLSGFFSVDHITDLAIVEKAGLAGVAAVLSLLKGIAAQHVGNPNSASLVETNEPR